MDGNEPRRSADGEKSANLIEKHRRPTRFVGLCRAAVVFVVWLAALFALRAAWCAVRWVPVPPPPANVQAWREAMAGTPGAKCSDPPDGSEPTREPAR